MDDLELTNKTHRQIFCYNEKIGHLYIPNLNARIINENGGYFVKTNSQGFRSNINFTEKKNTKKRIIFLGDSNTAADGVSNHERFSDIIGNYFDAETYNFALSGTGTDQQYLIWENYAKNIEADLIVLGVLVENIDRNKVAFRESINPFNKKSLLTPKPFFEHTNGILNLKNVPVPRLNEIKSKISRDQVQWTIPDKHKFLYKIVNFLRENKTIKPIRDNFDPILEKIRSLVIKNTYQPFSDYKDINSKGYILMANIIKKFILSINKIPIIIFPIPTYHYYVDEAKPIYQKFFKNFQNIRNNIYVCDPLEKLLSMRYIERKSLSFKKDKSHFSKQGHKILSNFLINEIENNKLLKKGKKYIIQNNKSVKKKSTYILGISAFYHDAAATLIKDGEIIAAAQEERFSRVKNDRRFPISAINFCLEKAGIDQNKLSSVVYYDNPLLTFERIFWSLLTTAPKSINTWLKIIPSWVKYKFFIPDLIRKKINYNGKIFNTLHHRSHIAAAFFPSPFRKAAILTIDGVGEWATASIAIGNENKFKILKEIHFPNSLGLLYSAFTQFTGFKVNSGEYKMMGLAPYGKPKYTDIILKELIELNDDGSIKINQKYFSYVEGSYMTNENFSNLFGGPARKPDSRITQREMDIAASIQKVTEKVIIYMAKYTKRLTGESNLCLAGGVALNCVANGYLVKEKIFEEIWIQPASGDAGSSLGSALDIYYSHFKNSRKIEKNNGSIQKGSCLGPEWNESEIFSFLKSQNIKFKKLKPEERGSVAADYLNKGKVIGHFTGRTEFGPRSLGSRSIIGDPRNKDMQSIMNLKIKKRESFRPFAPAVLLEKVHDYFELNKSSPYMLLVSQVKKSRQLPLKNTKTENMINIVNQIRSDIPAVTHVDYSARIQTVEKEHHRKFFDLISSFEKLSGCPLVVNTSFNVRGEPIVNTPMDAYRCFMKTEIDVLLLEDYCILKEEQNSFNNTDLMSFNNERKNSKELKFLRNDLKKIYKKYMMNILKKYKEDTQDNSNSKSSWINCNEQNNTEQLFCNFPEYDIKNHNSEKIADTILKNWTKTSLGAVATPIINDVIKLSKKYSLEEDLNSEVSENIYEMF